MKSNFNNLGNYIRQANSRNIGLKVIDLKGININKEFMPSVANINGTDLSKYKIVRKGLFAFNPMHVGRDEVLPISLWQNDDPIIVSPAYVVFDVIDNTLLDPEYLMMWCRRSEFDRNCWFTTDSSVRGGLAWDDFCDLKIKIISMEDQKKVVCEYNKIKNRMNNNIQLIACLESILISYFNKVFSSFLSLEDDTDSTELSYFIDFNPTESIKKGSLTKYIEMSDIQQNQMNITGLISRPYTSGSKFKNGDTLLARITPCMENGKVAYVNQLNNDEVGFGSTEFIVMRPTAKGSKYFNYCLSRNEFFRSYAISSMSGSDGRLRVQHDYLKVFPLKKIPEQTIKDFDRIAAIFFTSIEKYSKENNILKEILNNILSKLAA